MQNFRVLSLISGIAAVVAIACGSAASPTTVPPTIDAPSPTGTVSARPVGPTSTPDSTSTEPPVDPTTVPEKTIQAPPGVVGSFVIVEPTGLVEPDPDFQDELRSVRFSTRSWQTDFSLHTVPYSDFLSGGPPRDGIPPIDNPKFVGIDEADEWLSDEEPVISFELNGENRAYPLQILIWHEVVNDVVGGVPVTVTFCPLCNSAIVVELTVDGMVLDFGTSGNPRNSDLVMWDRQTESWWQQLTGEAIVGVMAGTKLKFLPAPIVSWQDFMTYQPDGVVLSKATGFGRRYGDNPYMGYDRVDSPPFLYDGELDERLQPKERVAAISVDGVDAAFPFSVLADEGAVNYRVNGVDVAVFFKSGTRSALDGPLFGQRLTKIVHGDHFWFAWGAFKPETLIYQGQN